MPAAVDPRSNTSCIELSHVDFHYGDDGDAPALHDICLRIEAGEHVCVLGGNGSGKSTLVQLMNALLVPCAGTATVFGLDTALPDAVAPIRQQAAMVFQHPEDQMTTSIVADDVAFGPENLGIPSKQIAQRVDDALATVEMTAFAQADPADLSGGQQQRVAIAGALAMHPRVLLLDEPGAMLDAAGRSMIQRTVAQLNRKGITIVHVTHFMDEALRANRAIILERGRIAFDGDPREAFAQPELITRLGLELPPYLDIAVRLQEAGLAVAQTGDPHELARSIAGALRVGRGEREAIIDPSVARPRAAAALRTPAAGAAPAVRFDDVSFSYATARSPRKRARTPLFGRTRRAEAPTTFALEHASFAIAPGTTCAFIGRTGSGKSTAMELACALKVPAAGTVDVEGIDTADLERRRELRRRVGYVSQLPERQLFAETVYDDVAFGPRNLGCAPDETDRLVHDALRACGLEPTEALLARSPFALSGGQQRSVALAGVLAMKPQVVVLDEPMAGLDPIGRAGLARLLGRLKRAGVTLLLVSHSMDDVAALADRVIALDAGRVVADGAPRDIFLQDTPVLADLGAPAALVLTRLLADEGVDLDISLVPADLVEKVIRHGTAR